MENTYNTRVLEDKITEELDDLLVANKIEKPRETHFSFPPFGIGMVVQTKDKPRVDFKMEIYPNETEEPHFKITYQNVTCRFKITDCSPMKAEARKGIPSQIQKIMREIKQTWKNNQKELIAAWHNSRPTNQHHGHQHIR